MPIYGDEHQSATAIPREPNMDAVYYYPTGTSLIPLAYAGQLPLGAAKPSGIAPLMPEKDGERDGCCQVQHNQNTLDSLTFTC